MLQSFHRHRRALLGLTAALVVGAVLQLTNTNPAVSQSQHITAYAVPEDPGLDPGADVWDRIGAVSVPLTAQSGSYIAGGSVETIRAEAVHYNGRLYLRISWADSSQNDSTTRAEDFSDAVAVEFPAEGGTSVPSICMGQEDAAVNIWQWRADSDAGVRDPSLVYTSAQVDGYPSLETLFYTAREVGNPYADPKLGAAQTLTARAFGNLAPLGDQNVQARGAHGDDGWSVVFVRDMNVELPGHAALAPSTTTDMAFAVWDGEKDERNGKKAVSQFVTLNIAGAPAFADGGNDRMWAIIAVALLVGVAALGAGLATYGYREGGR